MKQRRSEAGNHLECKEIIYCIFLFDFRVFQNMEAEKGRRGESWKQFEVDTIVDILKGGRGRVH